MMKIYKKFLELKDKYDNRGNYIASLLEANGYLYFYIDDILYTEEGVRIKTSSNWSFADEYQGIRGRIRGRQNDRAHCPRPLRNFL